MGVVIAAHSARHLPKHLGDPARGGWALLDIPGRSALVFVLSQVERRHQQQAVRSDHVFDRRDDFRCSAVDRPEALE